MRIKQTGLILLLGGLLFSQSTPGADSTKKGTDSLANVSSTVPAPVTLDTAQISTDTNNYVKQNELLDLKELIDNNAKRALISRYTVNFAGFGCLGVSATFKDQPTFGFSSPLTNSGVLAGLSLSGKLRDDPSSDGDISYRVNLNLFGKTDGATNASGVVTGVLRGFSLADVALNWDILSIKSGLDPFFIINTTFGQFLKPFGNENLATEDKRPTIRSAQYLGAYGIGRDIGLQVDAGFFNAQDDFTALLNSRIALTAAVFNGAGANAEDPTRGKDVILKVVFTPITQYFNPLYGLKFGGSVQWTDLDYKGDSLKTARTLLGGQLEYLKKPFLLTSEFVQSKTDKPLFGYKTTQSAIATLFYTAAALPDFQPLIRYDWFDPDIANDGHVNKIDDQQIVTLGFNWFLYAVEPVTRQSYSQAKTERVIKIQINYNIKLENNDAPKLKNDELLGLIVFNF